MTYKEAMSSTKKQEWENAIVKEYKSLIQNGTWELNNFPKGKNKVGCRWVFKRKLKENGSIDKYKARLVAKGYSQIHGLDYHEKISLVMKIASIRVLLALATNKNYEVHQMDVKTTFLNKFLQEEIYMKQPKGFVLTLIVNIKFAKWKRIYMNLNNHPEHGMKYLIFP